MGHSNSSLNCFAACQAKYKHQYILHTPPEKPVSPHLVFGVMAHEVMYKAGKLRDDIADHIVDSYDVVIPSEVAYSELKTEFQIPNWHSYFVAVCKQVAQYEGELIKELQEHSPTIMIERELKIVMRPEEVRKELGYTTIEDNFTGIIDLLLLGKEYATIIDYKFSTTRKTQDDFDQNSQLYMYAMFVHCKYGIPLRNIKVGYIDIPKKAFDQPVVLSNGTLSRSKSQNVSADMYKKCVEAIHGDDPKYNCEPDGYYYECYCALMNNKAAYLSTQYLDQEAYEYIMDDLVTCAELIEKYTEQYKQGKSRDWFLRKYDSYSCRGCEFLHACKPWLAIGDENAMER